MIHLHHAISLALIYTYRATNGEVTMISSEKTKEYEKVINNNLKAMNSKINSLTPDYLVNPDELFFSYVKNINDEGYYILKMDNDKVAARKRYIMNLPLDVILASEKPNALDVIDLVMIDGQIMRQNLSKKKVKIKE